MRLRAPAACLLALLAAACATRTEQTVTVHVFSNAPGAERVDRVTRLLEAAGYPHHIRYAKTPGGLNVEESVVVHGDGAAAFNRAQALARLLEREAGITPRIAREAYGNHHFTRGHLGLYLYLPGQAGTEPELEVSAMFVGTCAERALDLRLFVGGLYTLQLQRWRGEFELVSEGVEHGRWTPRGAGYDLVSEAGADWTLEPQIGRADPIQRVVFVRQHPQLDGCRLAEPL
jgi:hypothetical protein